MREKYATAKARKDKAIVIFSGADAIPKNRKISMTLKAPIRVVNGKAQPFELQQFQAPRNHIHSRLPP